MFIGVSSRLKCGFSCLLFYPLDIVLFYFSGTGNSRWVAGQLADALDEVAVRVTEALQAPSAFSLRPDEPLGFVFPVYAWGPPPLVLELVRALRLPTVPAYVYFVCTCGDDTGRTAEVFGKAVRERGWTCKAGFSVTMPNTYVCLPGFDVDAPAVERRKRDEAVARVGETAARIRERWAGTDCHEGGFPWLKTYVLRPFFHRYLMSPRHFHTVEACTGCGGCARVCPLHNIQLKNGRPVWGDRCTMCLACYHHCPQRAVRYGRSTEDKGQYVCQ